jgi:hypothetical protein
MVSRRVIGKSIEGRNITRFHIHSPNSETTSKPGVFLEALQHAREWISPPTALFSIQRIVSTFETDERVKRLLTKMHIHYVPIVNPDGYMFAWSGNRMWRKNRRQNSDRSFGVDLNRNWKSGFGGSGSSGQPSSETYRGTAAYSEPETKCIADYLLANMNTLKAAIDFHSYSQLMLRPWGKQSSNSPDEEKLRNLGQKMCDAIQAVNRVRYENIKSSQLYVASGIVGDDFYETFKLDGYTIELRPGRFGGGGFAPPPSQIMPTCSENYQAVLTIMEHVYNLN